MVDVPRTLADLQTLLADNASGDISPQDIRDFLLSVYPKHFDVMAYGAVGNGSTDDTEAIQDALDAAALVGGTVLLPSRTFLVTGLSVASNVTLSGCGWSSVLKGVGTGPVILSENSNLFRIENLRIEGDATPDAIGIGLYGAQRFAIDRVVIQNLSGSGAYALHMSKYDDSGTLRNTVDGDVYNIQIRNCTNGIMTTKPVGDAQTFGASFIRFLGGDVRGFTGYGFNLDHGEGISCFGTRFATSVAGSTCIRINDDANAFFNCAADCSAAQPNGSTGFLVEASASDNHIYNPIGDGAEYRVVDYGNNTFILRQAFNSIPTLSLKGTGQGNPFALSGVLRIPNNESIRARNASNTGDVTLVRLSAQNKVLVDPDGSGLILALPTSDPGVANQLWADGGYVRISSGV